jgi:putative MATE family efflux protein
VVARAPRPRCRGRRWWPPQYQIYLLLDGRSKLAIARAHLRFNPRVMLGVLRLSSSAALQMLISMTSYIGVMRILSSFGSAPLAGYTIGFRVLMFALLPAFGLANAAATLVGQNLGAGRADRAEQSVWRACRFGAIVLTVVGLGFLLGAGPLVSLFTSDPEVRSYGIRYLRIVSLGFPFYAFGMVLSQAFNGAGDTWTPTLINLFVFWVVQLPLAWALSNHSSLGPSGVFITLALCFSIFAMVAAVLFRRGAWQRTRV